MENDSLQYKRPGSRSGAERREVSPAQHNTQNVNVTVNMPETDYSGQISGVAYYGEDRQIAPQTPLYGCFFGNDGRYPVCNNELGRERAIICSANCRRGITGSSSRFEQRYTFEAYSVKVLPQPEGGADRIADISHPMANFVCHRGGVRPPLLVCLSPAKPDERHGVFSCFYSLECLRHNVVQASCPFEYFSSLYKPTHYVILLRRNLH